MKKYYIAIIFQTWIFSVVRNEHQKLYSRYKVFEMGGVEDFDDSELHAKMNFDSEDEFEILQRNRLDGTAHVLVKPKSLRKFKKVARNYDFSYKILIDDVGRLIRSHLEARKLARPLHGKCTFVRYMNLKEIYEYLSKMKNKHKSKVKLVSIGKSFNGETIQMISISNDIENETNKPVIFIEAGNHAREWIGVAAAVYTIDRVLNSPNLTRDVEWQIVPVLNPDGYQYTFQRDRMWRKNRRIFFDQQCDGVDLNRNFDYHWGEIGASLNACEDDYAGTSAFSETETQAVRDAFIKVKDRVKAYIAIHSYGKFILIPSNKKLTDNKECSDWMNDLAMKMADDIESATKSHFTYGFTDKILYVASGTSMDWVLDAGKSLISFSLELRGNKETEFLLPESEIKDGVAEFWIAMNTLYKIIGFSDSRIGITMELTGPCFKTIESR